MTVNENKLVAPDGKTPLSSTTNHSHAFVKTWIASVLTSAVFTGGVAFIARGVVDNRMQMELAAQKHEFAKDLEEQKNALAKDFQNEIQRTNAIGATNELLARLDIAINRVHNSIAANDPRWTEYVADLNPAYISFRLAVRKNRAMYLKETIAMIDSFEKRFESWTKALMSKLSAPLSENTDLAETGSAYSKTSREMRDAWDLMQNAITTEHRVLLKTP
ncbi:MAG: hypothetical protein AAFV88_12500 [Planctomycetota bacterium]